MVTSNRDSFNMKSPTHSFKQSELKGPKIDMRSGLRSETFNVGNEEEKADLETRVSYNKTSKNQLQDNLITQKFNSDNYHSTEDDTPGVSSNQMVGSNASVQSSTNSASNKGLPPFYKSPFSRANGPKTVNESHGLGLDTYSLSELPPRSKVTNPSPGNCLTPVSRHQQKANTYAEGNLNVEPEENNESPNDSPSVFDEKRARIRPKKLETEKIGFYGGTEESYLNEISLFSKNVVYQRNPRVNLTYVNSPVYRNSLVSPISRSNNYKIGKFETEKFSHTQAREPGNLLKWNEELKGNTRIVGSESAMKIGPHLDMDLSLGFRTGKPITRTQGPYFNFPHEDAEDPRINTTIAESRNSSPTLMKQVSDVSDNFELRKITYNSRPSMPTMGSKLYSYKIPPSK